MKQPGLFSKDQKSAEFQAAAPLDVRIAFLMTALPAIILQFKHQEPREGP